MKSKFILLSLFIPFFAFSQTRDNAGGRGAEGAVSGFFETYNPVNYPIGASSWWHLLDVRHSNVENNYAMQFSGSFFDQQLYFRKTNNDANQPWSKVLLQTDGKSIVDGRAWFSYGNTNMGGYSWTNAALTTNSIEIVNNNGTVNHSSPTLAFHRYGSGGPQFRLSADDSNILYLESSGENSARSPSPYGGGPNNYFSKLYVDGGLVTSGNVGIGTSSLAERLNVDGKIRAREIKVEATNWPDYVFAEGYKTETLEGLASYIKKHKHLPEMPSAADAEKDGIELGEMNKLLLKKVEELTLHLIDLSKKVDLIQKENIDLKQVMNKNTRN
jgi:hypothetical protein